MDFIANNIAVSERVNFRHDPQFTRWPVSRSALYPCPISQRFRCPWL